MSEDEEDMVKMRKKMSKETEDLMYKEESSVMPRLRAVEDWQKNRQRRINHVKVIAQRILIGGLALGAASALGWFTIQKLFM